MRVRPGAYLRGDHRKEAHLGRLRPYLRTLHSAGKAFQGKHTSLLKVAKTKKCFLNTANVTTINFHLRNPLKPL